MYRDPSDGTPRFLRYTPKLSAYKKPIVLVTSTISIINAIANKK